MRQKFLLMLVLIVFSQDTSALQADFNNDCKVNLDDFLLFSKAFIAFQNQGILNSEFDLDNDNEVEIKDFFLFADSYYGAECGALEEGICPKGFILDAYPRARERPVSSPRWAV